MVHAILLTLMFYFSVNVLKKHRLREDRITYFYVLVAVQRDIRNNLVQVLLLLPLADMLTML